MSFRDASALPTWKAVNSSEQGGGGKCVASMISSFQRNIVFDIRRKCPSSATEGENQFHVATSLLCVLRSVEGILEEGRNEEEV